MLGIAGVEGNGQAELVETIMGMRRPTGTIGLGADDITHWSTRGAGRPASGSSPRIGTGTGCSSRRRCGRTGSSATDPRAERQRPADRPAGGPQDTERIVEEFDVRTPGIDVPALALSGGNQQKLIIGREMTGDPVLLVASHPTRGVDVGAQAAIWDDSAPLAGGLAVLLISADLEELIGMSDAIQVMLRGRFVGESDPSTVTPRNWARP